MLPDIKNEKGNCLDVRDDISGKNAIRHTFESLAADAFILVIVVIVDSKPINLCYRCYNNIFNTYFLMCIILKYIEILIYNNFTFK